MKTQLSIIILLAIFVSACKKNEKFAGVSHSSSVAVNAASIATGPANPINPFDSIGYLHNALLADIQPCLASFYPPNNDEISGCVIKLAAKEQLNESATPFFLIPKVVADQNNNFKNVIANCQYSPYTKLLLDSLVQTINEAASNSNGAYAIVKSAIVAFETPIIENSKLSLDERQVILEVTSVARYSIYYWIHQSAQQGLSIKRFIMTVGTAMTDAFSLAVYRSVGFAADSSECAWLQMTYSIPGDM